MKRRFIGVALIGLSLFAMMLTFAYGADYKRSVYQENRRFAQPLPQIGKIVRIICIRSTQRD